jgi:hypothetical protein
MGEVDELELSRILERQGTDEQRQMVRALVNLAAPILDRIIETFPTYTLHNSKHARNVAELMADILGEHLKDLTPLEAAFLILSAYWHDIGMVFKEEDRARLAEEPEWADFLQKHAEAYLAVSGDPRAEPPRETAEWYCRWRHADRVFVYINAAAARGLSFRWGVVDLREALGNLCRSHNESTNRIQANPVLRPDFRAGEADLQFCAILLRLADILDFDRSRSPDSVYQYLGLKRRADPREKASDVEWRKHLAAEGFVFPTDRSQGYALDFIAGPDHPAVEHDLRQFLDVIDSEFEQCAALLPICSKRWRDVALPARIRRESIVSSGYRYGDYHFSLDQRQVLDLLMGENLYDSPYVFIREMLQNALDASRLREHLERLRGSKDFKAQPIRVSEWLDRDSYRWVRFDDFGTGMDEQIVRDHLLKVGSSYYTSTQYEADKLRASKGLASDFAPISRFGIGLLSCFIAADRVEISTLRQLPTGPRAAPVRFSLDGLYTLQTPDLAPAPMPTSATSNNEEPDYRTEFGTSIAIRLDPRKQREPLDLRAELERYLLCPPVPVEYEGQSVGGDPKDLLETPWCDPVTIKPTPAEVEALLGFRLPEAFRIELQPLDLTRYTPTNGFRAQVALASLIPSNQLKSIASKLRNASAAGLSWHLNLAEDLRVSIQADLWSTDPDRIFMDNYAKQLLETLESHRDDNQAVIHTTLRSFSDYINEPGIALTCTSEELLWFESSSKLLISHNGIRLPEEIEHVHHPKRIDFNVKYPGAEARMVLGLISLTDRMRPNLSVDRERIRSLPWEVYSAAGLATRKTVAELMQSPDDLFWCSDPISPFDLVDDAALARLLCDPLLDAWASEKIFASEDIVDTLTTNVIDTRSLSEIVESIKMSVN